MPKAIEVTFNGSPDRLAIFKLDDWREIGDYIGEEIMMTGDYFPGAEVRLVDVDEETYEGL